MLTVWGFGGLVGGVPPEHSMVSNPIIVSRHELSRVSESPFQFRPIIERHSELRISTKHRLMYSTYPYELVG